MKNDMRNPRSGVAVLFLCASVLVIWAIAAYGAYEESKGAMYNVAIKPGSVTYGTHSTAVVPMTSNYSSAPMVSAGTVRSYAYAGHASMPAAKTAYASGGGKGMYTTSSAHVHTIGSGGGSGGGGNVGSSGGYSARTKVSYGGGGISVHMPTLALNTPSVSAATTTSTTEETLPRTIGPRKVNPHAGETGSAGEKYQDTDDPNIWWYWDEDWDGEEGDGWVSGYPPKGTIKEEGGFIYEADGEGGWDLKGEIPDLGTPVGATPWIMLMLFAAAYVLMKRKRAKQRVS